MRAGLAAPAGDVDVRVDEPGDQAPPFQVRRPNGHAVELGRLLGDREDPAAADQDRSGTEGRGRENVGVEEEVEHAAKLAGAPRCGVRDV